MTDSRRVHFGISGLSAQSPQRDAAGYAREIANVVSLCELAEEVGIDSIWTNEHHCTDDGHMPAPLVLLGAISARTSRITIGTNVIQAPLWNPVRLAEEAAVVDQLSRGRLVLGLGLGYREAEFTTFGLERKERAQRLETSVSMLRAARAIEDGGDGGITPTPYRSSGIPIWIGAMAETAVRRAARIADGFIAPPMLVNGVAKRINWIDDEHRGTPFTLAICLDAFVAEHEARETALRGIEYSEGQYNVWLRESGDLPTLGDTSERWLREPPDYLVVGTPSECVERLRPWMRLLAEVPPHWDTHVLLRLTYPVVDPADNEQSVRLFAQEVVPALRGAA